MREPRAEPTSPPVPNPESEPIRTPRAVSSAVVEETPDAFAGLDPLDAGAIAPEPARPNRWLWRLIWGAGGLLVSLGIGLAAERLVRDLFARYEVLGWIGLAASLLLVAALGVLGARELAALFRLRSLDALRDEATAAIESNSTEAAQAVVARLLVLYAGRPDMARQRDSLGRNAEGILDAEPLIATAERTLLGELDQRAKTLVANSARRVALVTAVSPRALIDIAFVLFESLRLARTLADLYGARPGALGFVRLVRSVLAHLAVTGGLVLTDGVVEQLVGQSVASRVSARLGEGLVNGLMTVRVGIAAITVVRPLPHRVRPAPRVADFVGELARVARSAANEKEQR